MKPGSNKQLRRLLEPFGAFVGDNQALARIQIFGILPDSRARTQKGVARRRPPLAEKGTLTRPPPCGKGDVGANSNRWHYADDSSTLLEISSNPVGKKSSVWSQSIHKGFRRTVVLRYYSHMRKARQQKKLEAVTKTMIRMSLSRDRLSM